MNAFQIWHGTAAALNAVENQAETIRRASVATMERYAAFKREMAIRAAEKVA